MKKIFRTLLAVMVAVIMSFTIVAFAGCNDDNGNNNNNNNNNNNTNSTVTPGLATGNKTYDSIIDTKFAGVTLASTTTYDGETFGETFSLNAKVNTSGTADIVFAVKEKSYEYYDYYFVRDWAIYGAYGDEEITDFTEAELKGYIDINQAVEACLDFIGESGVELPEGATDLFDLAIVGDIADTTVGGLNYLILSLADAADAVTVTDGKVTVDINKLVYNMVNDFKNLFDGLTESTTIGDILNNATLKKYLQIFTELATPNDIIEAVKAVSKEFSDVIDELTKDFEAEAFSDDPESDDPEPDEAEFIKYLAMASAMLKEVDALLDTVKPDEDSSVYDYIVKILSSQELVDLINDALKNVSGMLAGIGLTKKITDFTLGEIFTMVFAAMKKDITFNDFKELVNGYIESFASGITQTSFSITEDEEELFSFTESTLVYSYNDSGLTSMKLGMKLMFEGEEEMTIDGELSFSKTAYAKSEFATLPAELPEIEDIDLGNEKNPSNPAVDYKLEYGSNRLSLPAGEIVTLEVDVPDYELLHIYTEDENVTLYTMLNYGSEITVYNYVGLSISAYFDGNSGETVVICVEEEDGFDLPELWVDDSFQFSCDYFEAAIFQLNVTVEGDYMLQFDNCNAEDLYIVVGTEYDARLNVVMPNSDIIELDAGAYHFEEGVIYVALFSNKTDAEYNYLEIEDTVSIRLY